jgi:hypothetical protein
MFFRRKHDKHSLYYLLPGMTRANRVKRRKILWASFLVGIFAALLVGGVIWFLHRGPRP